jgi:DNA-binding protein YbaB
MGHPDESDARSFPKRHHGSPSFVTVTEQLVSRGVTVLTGPISGDDEAAVNAKLDAWVTAAREKAQRYRSVQADTSQVSITETSKDGLVTVTVDANGTMTDLRLTDGVRELSGQQVAAAVLATVRRANAKIPERIAEILRDRAADDRATIDAVLANYRSRFPEPEPDAPPDADCAQDMDTGRPSEPAPRPAPRPRPRPRPADDGDDDWEGPTILGE